MSATASTTTASITTVTGLDFLALQVRDVAAAAAFFEERLGLRRAPVSPPGAVVFATEPVPVAVREPLPGTDLDAGRPGLGVALWFAVPDASGLHDRLRGDGVEVLAPVTPSPFGPTFSFVGPEGYVLTVHGGMTLTERSTGAPWPGAAIAGPSDARAPRGTRSAAPR